MDTRLVTVRLPTELTEKLDTLAKHRNRPRAWIVKEAIASYVKHNETRHRLTLEALADADAGRLIDHTEIEARVTRWIEPKPTRQRRA
jgi:predicted transcriptional regulator